MNEPTDDPRRGAARGRVGGHGVQRAQRPRQRERGPRARRSRRRWPIWATCPTGVAQTLRGGESHVIGLCTPLTSSAYFAALLEMFEDLGGAAGLRDHAGAEPRRSGARTAPRAGAGRPQRRRPDPHSDARFAGRRSTCLPNARMPTVVVDRVTGDPPLRLCGDRRSQARCATRRAPDRTRAPAAPVSRARHAAVDDAAAHRRAIATPRAQRARR